MKKKNYADLLISVKNLENKSDYELEAFELILDICKEKGYKIEEHIQLEEECTLCEQQKFMHLVAMKDDEILDLVYDFHTTFSEPDFCKEDLKSKYEILLLENTFEIVF